ISPAAICCGTPPTLAMMVPAKPPTRNLSPFRSSLDLISLRNQPPIWAPVLPVGIPRQLYSFRRSLSISWPPPHNSHEICCRVLSPNGTAVPFGLNTRQHISWLLWGGGQDMLNDLLKEYNCLGIPTGSTGAQMGGWFRKEIKSSEDLKGLKFRVGGFAGTIIARVGGVPQQIAAGDIYPALEKGTIDAAEWVGPYDDEKLGFVKVAKYYYYPGWWEGTGQGHNIVNIEKWNALPKHYQAAITAASHDTFTWVTGKYDYVNPPALKRLVAAGAILRPFPQEVLETCYNAANEIYAELSKSNPHFGKMYASLVAYRNESLAWMQVAELSSDSFMMRMRTRT